jgi:thiamine pyrophosphate-dependent acetolactate synthase large subunit-like protein
MRSEPVAPDGIVIACAELHFTSSGQADMAQNVADFFWMRLYEWGVRRVFGYPGDGINGLLGGLQRLGDDKIRFIQARHEEMAAFMASAYAKFTGRLGVCIATSGPGASHLITGLYDARLDHMPVLAIAGQQARTAVGGHYQQEVDLVSMFKDVAEPSSIKPACRHRCGTWWIAPSASRLASAV